MPELTVNNIEMAYETWGEPGGPVVTLIQGLGMPLNAWPPGFIEHLTDAGFYVLAMDNRDIGYSKTFDEHGIPNLAWHFLRSRIGLPATPPYTLNDMALDVAGLLARLSISKAHVVGVSMGGMISQRLAIDHPDRCASLTSIMSTTGNRRLPKPRPEVLRQLIKRPMTDDIESRLEHSLKMWRLISSPGYEIDYDYLEQRLRAMYERGMTRGGVARQMMAIGSAKNRVRELRKLQLPSLVIHGKADPLVPVSGGVDTANAIPNARLELIEGMGHDLPVGLHAHIAGLIIEHVNAAEFEARAA